MKAPETFMEEPVNFDKYFAPLKPKALETPKGAEVSADTTPVEVKHPEKLETCGVPFTVTHKEKMPLKGECAIEQTHPNKYIILNEYVDENPMNKEAWGDGVNLYDEFGSSYASYMTVCEEKRQHEKKV